MAYKIPQKLYVLEEPCLNYLGSYTDPSLEREYYLEHRFSSIHNYIRDNKKCKCCKTNSVRCLIEKHLWVLIDRDNIQFQRMQN